MSDKLISPEPITSRKGLIPKLVLKAEKWLILVLFILIPETDYHPLKSLGTDGRKISNLGIVALAAIFLSSVLKSRSTFQKH